MDPRATGQKIKNWHQFVNLIETSMTSRSDFESEDRDNVSNMYDHSKDIERSIYLALKWYFFLNVTLKS